MPRLAPGSALLLAALTIGCTRGEPPGADRSEPAASSQEPDKLEPPRPQATLAPSSASARPNASAPDAAADSGPIDWKNRAKPELSSAELEQHGRALLEAIIHDDPELARDFFFPREPFKPLKDVADADKYWVQLFAVYKRDIRELHRKRRDWSGVSFESLTLGTPPTWVKPGDEYNKIGYFRTFSAKLRYSVDGRKLHFTISTIISWNGQWYITHLAPIQH